MFDVNDDAKGEYRRVEILTGPGRRRRWSAEQKARIVAETLIPGACVSEGARRWQLWAQQVFGWRCAARRGQRGRARLRSDRQRSHLSDADCPRDRDRTHRRRSARSLAHRRWGPTDRGVPRGARLGHRAMINIPVGARILLATQPIDFRKGAHSLAALAQQVLGENPFSGTVYRGKRSDTVKLLVWDTSGLVLVWKQLQQGSFRWLPIMDGVMKLSPVGRDHPARGRSVVEHAFRAERLALFLPRRPDQ